MSERADTVWKTSTLAQVYLEGVRGAIPLAAEQIDVMLRLVGACGRPPQRVLDLGCGDGVLAGAVLERYPGTQAVLLDFAAPMLERAAHRFAGCDARVSFVNADYGLPSWTRAVQDAAPFDAVVSGYSIHHQPDDRKREIYAEILEVLAPGGIFINVEHVSSPSPWIESLSDELFVDRLHAHHPDQAREEVAAQYYRRPDKAANILAPVERQCEWLRSLGFADVDCFLKVFELAVFGGRKPLP
jgi:tRNA (cmo5U34)-methyltransferase